MILGQYSSKVKMECNVDPAVYLYALLGTGAILYAMSGYIVELSNYDLSMKLLMSLSRCEELRQRVAELESADTISDTEDTEQKQE